MYNSTIHVYLDMTNQQVGFTLQMRLAEAFQAFASSVLASCHIPDSVTSLPIQVECEKKITRQSILGSDGMTNSYCSLSL